MVLIILFLYGSLGFIVIFNDDCVEFPSTSHFTLATLLFTPISNTYPLSSHFTKSLRYLSPFKYLT